MIAWCTGEGRWKRIKTKRAKTKKFCLGIDLLAWSGKWRKDRFNKRDSYGTGYLLASSGTVLIAGGVGNYLGGPEYHWRRTPWLIIFASPKNIVRAP